MKNVSNKLKRKLSRGDNSYKGSVFLVFKLLLILFPVVLFFSYYPVIRLGSDGAMYYELSLPLIWLVLFDLVGAGILIQRRKLFTGFRKWWIWLLLPVYLTLTVFWSENRMRGALTAGMMWAVVVAIYILISLRRKFNEEFRVRFWKVFFVGTLVICVWCVVQCALDLAGILREYSLMCLGCTYRSFGFPHPNGFAVEPQFMGNLLLAPTLIAAWLLMRRQSKRNLERKSSRGDNFDNRSVGAHTKLQFRDSLRDCCQNHSGSDFLGSKFLLLCFFVITVVLFLTFSRGAIYAFVVALIFMTMVWRPKQLPRDTLKGARPSLRSRVKCFRAPVTVWIIIIIATVSALNLQGIMAAVSPTNDTYFSGVAKVLNHLSLGIIDIRGNGEVSEKTQALESGKIEGNDENSGEIGVEKPVENLVDNTVDKSENEADYDGYVEESTATRMQLSRVALELWSKDIRTMLFGVGLGGAGQALYNNGLIDWPKEIVQNEYVSLLLETGLVGIMLLVMVLILIVRTLLKIPYGGMVFALIVAYGISLVFFAGLPNALHIYLMPVFAVTLWQRGED